MLSIKTVSPEDPPSISMRKDFHHIRDEYGLQIDYLDSPSSAVKAATSKDSDELVTVCGLVFKADPLTRELVLHDYADLRQNHSFSQIGIRPGDILCKLDDVDVHYWSPSSLSSFMSEISRKVERLGLYRKGSGFPGLIFADVRDQIAQIYSPRGDLDSKVRFGSPSGPSQMTQMSHISRTNIAGNMMFGSEAQSSHDSGSTFSLDHEARDESRHSSMQANVLKRYKSKIESLTKSLESAHMYMSKQEEKISSLEEKLLAASDRPAMTSSSPNDSKELSWQAEKAALLKDSENSKYQVIQTEQELHSAQALIETLKRELSNTGGRDSHVESLQQEISSLKSELQLLKSQSLGPSMPSDSAKIFSDLHFDLEATYAAKNDLEAQVAALKRNSLIQVVEIKELQDHISGLEKQMKAGEILRFPPLPGLESVWESLLEEIPDEAKACKMLVAADEEIHRAQREIQYLKTNEHRLQQLEMMRQQSEVMLEAAQREVKALRDAPSSINNLNAVRQGTGSDQGRLQTAEQSLLKANLIVSGQSKQLDDLRSENEQLLQNIRKLEDQLKASRYEASDLMQRASLDSERYRAETAAEFESIQRCLLESQCKEQTTKEDLEETRKLLVKCRAQCSAAESENRILQSQLEGIMESPPKTIEADVTVQERIKQLESELDIKTNEVVRLQQKVVKLIGETSNSTQQQTEANTSSNRHIRDSDSSSNVKGIELYPDTQGQIQALQNEIAVLKSRDSQAEATLKFHLNVIKDLREEIARSQIASHEGNTLNLVSSFDSLTEEFQLLKECMMPQDVSEALSQTTQNQLLGVNSQMQQLRQQIQNLSDQLAHRDADLLTKQKMLDDLADQVKAHHDSSNKSISACKSAHRNLVCLLKEHCNFEYVGEADPVNDILNITSTVSSFIAKLQAAIKDQQIHIARLSNQREEALLLLKNQGLELATAKVVTKELEAEIAHVRTDRDQAIAALQNYESDLQHIQIELEAKREQVNVLTSIVEAIRTANPVTWSDIPGHQFQGEFNSELECIDGSDPGGTLSQSVPKKPEAAYHF